MFSMRRMEKKGFEIGMLSSQTQNYTYKRQISFCKVNQSVHFVRCVTAHNRVCKAHVIRVQMNTPECSVVWYVAASQTRSRLFTLSLYYTICSDSPL